MSTTPPTSGTDARAGQILPLNALRGLAALLVVLSHLVDFGFQRIGPAQQGHLGVMVFFTLSGFLMGHLYLHKPLDRASLRGYAVARFSRIAPPYLIVVVAGFLIYTLVDPKFPYAIDGHNLLRHLLFSGNVSVLWSIPPEVQFYAFFIAIWFAVWRLVAARSAGPLIAIVVIGIAMMAVRGHVPGTFLASKLQYFAIGAFLGWAHRRIPDGLVSTRALALLQAGVAVLFALFMAGIVDLGTAYWLDVAPALVAGLAIFAYSRDGSAVTRVLHVAPLQRLGDWSFSLYLLHVPLLYAFQRLGLGNSLPLTLGVVVAVVAVSAVFSLLIEHPVCAATRRLLLGRGRRGPARTSPPALTSEG